jgi:hypothetical protein
MRVYTPFPSLQMARYHSSQFFNLLIRKLFFQSEEAKHARVFCRWNTNAH